MAEQIVNEILTTLAGQITSGATTLDVASATGFPVSGDFRIRIDAELALVTSVSGATFTVTRGIEGTTAAAHRKGALVRGGVLTAGGLAQFVADNGGGGDGTLTVYNAGAGTLAQWSAVKQVASATEQPGVDVLTSNDRAPFFGIATDAILAGETGIVRQSGVVTPFHSAGVISGAVGDFVALDASGVVDDQGVTTGTYLRIIGRFLTEAGDGSFLITVPVGGLDIVPGHAHTDDGQGGALYAPLFTEATAPATPASGQHVIYPDTDGVVHILHPDAADEILPTVRPIGRTGIDFGSSQTITGGVATVLTWADVAYDTGAYFDVGATNTITLPVNGRYRLTVQVEIDSSANGNDASAITLAVRDADSLSQMGAALLYDPGTGTYTYALSTDVDGSAGQQIEVTVAAGSLDATALQDEALTFLVIGRIG